MLESVATTPFYQSILSLRDEVLRLNTLGYSQKRIADELHIFPSVLSVIVNKIANDIEKSSKKKPISDRQVKQIFDGINNVSYNKLKSRIDAYLEILYNLSNDPNHTQEDVYFKDLYRDTPYDKMSNICGIYNCYYISSFSYGVKKEPLFIGYGDNRQKLIVQKGNDLGPTKLKGILYTTNNQTLTIQLKEENTIVRDQFIGHFILPPAYDNTFKILKGIAISVANTYLPIGRKVILKKVNNSRNLSDINTMETVFHNTENEINPEILDYLTSHKSYIDYYHIPKPQFDEKDLNAEQKIRDITEIS